MQQNDPHMRSPRRQLPLCCRLQAVWKSATPSVLSKWNLRQFRCFTQDEQRLKALKEFIRETGRLRLEKSNQSNKTNRTIVSSVILSCILLYCSFLNCLISLLRLISEPEPSSPDRSSATRNKKNLFCTHRGGRFVYFERSTANNIKKLVNKSLNLWWYLFELIKKKVHLGRNSSGNMSVDIFDVYFIDVCTSSHLFKSLQKSIESNWNWPSRFSTTKQLQFFEIE